MSIANANIHHDDFTIAVPFSVENYILASTCKCNAETNIAAIGHRKEMAQPCVVVGVD